MNKKIPKYLKLTFAASILGTSLLTGFPTNAYAEDTLTVTQHKTDGHFKMALGTTTKTVFC